MTHSPPLMARTRSTPRSYATSHTYDGLVTDHLLTWASGDDVLRMSKKQAPACPVVVFTVSGSEDITVAAMKSGFDHYVV